MQIPLQPHHHIQMSFHLNFIDDQSQLSQPPSTSHQHHRRRRKVPPTTKVKMVQPSASALRIPECWKTFPKSPAPIFTLPIEIHSRIFELLHPIDAICLSLTWYVCFSTFRFKREGLGSASPFILFANPYQTISILNCPNSTKTNIHTAHTSTPSPQQTRSPLHQIQTTRAKLMTIFLIAYPPVSPSTSVLHPPNAQQLRKAVANSVYRSCTIPRIANYITTFGDSCLRS